MEKFWEALYVRLSNDPTLCIMTGHTASLPMIKRGYSTENIKFSEIRTRAVTFQQWTDIRSNRSSTSPLRDITILFVCWGKKNDKEVCSLKDYLITLLDGCDLSNASLKNYHSEYDDFCSPPYYDKEELAWRMDIRFRFKVVLL
jgi:hypothetical protein